MATITGRVTDVTRAPLTGRFPRVFFRIQDAAGTGDHLIVSAKTEAVVDNASGVFEVDLVATDEMVPERLYTVSVDWDAGQELDVLERLRVPSGDWEMSDLLLRSGSPTAGIAYGYGPPPASLTKGMYYDLSTGTIYGTPMEVA